MLGIGIAVLALAVGVAVTAAAVIFPEFREQWTWLFWLAVAVSAVCAAFLAIVGVSRFRDRFTVVTRAELAELTSRANAAAPAGTYFVDRTVRLASLPGQSNALHGYTFERCEILGPAVLWLEGGTNFDQNGLDAGGLPPDRFFTVLPDGVPPPAGALVLSGCTLRHCTIHRVSFVGSSAHIQSVRVGFGLPPDG